MPERPFETTVLVRLQEFGYPERHAWQTIERLGEVLRHFGSHEILDWYWEESGEEAGRHRQENQSNGKGVAGGTVAVRTATGPSVHGGTAARAHDPAVEWAQPHDQPGGEHADGELDLRDFRGRLDRRREHVLGWLSELQHHQPIGGSVEDTDPQPEAPEADQTPVPESPPPEPAPEPAPEPTEEPDATEETEPS
jgi:hypothetical protein